MIRKVYKDLVKHISPSVSPMIAAGRVLKKLNPDCKVVFIGPCIAKKSEAKEKDLLGDIDYVLTFEELKAIFEALEINLSDMKEDPSIDYASKGGRIYARTGGVSTAIADVIKELFPGKYILLNSTHANGVKECREMLTKVMSGDIEANFMEGMGCVGGCVGGPKVLIPKEEGYDRVNEFGDSSEFKVATNSNCMLDILNRIGINSVDEFKDKSIVKIFERTF
jgi:iron only hydrogenase large subunit-like protein